MRIEQLFIPHKDAMQRAITLEDQFADQEEREALDRLFDNYKYLERKAEIWTNSVDDPSRCTLFVPYKRLEDISSPLSIDPDHIAENYKTIERWADSVYRCDCGCVGEADKAPDRCRLFIPYKECFMHWQRGFITLAVCQAQDFENWKAIDRWWQEWFIGNCDCCEIFGGTIIDVDGYRYHIFDTPGEFPASFCGTETEYLVVAGGGASIVNIQATGGGGGGGVLFGTGLVLNEEIITVGLGGDSLAPTHISDKPLAYGGNSSISALIVAFGGGRGPQGSALPGGDGGSGGGGNSGVLNGVPGAVGGLGVPGQGFDGGTGSFGAVTTGNRAGAGGGGAGGVGGDGAVAVAGNGGPGVEWPTGSGNYYGGGGGGGRRGGSGGTGGIGGGGNGSAGDAINPSNGVDGTGGGGGGTGFGSTDGGDGGWGQVIIRYPFEV